MDIKKIVEDVIKDFGYRPELQMEVHSDEGSYHVVFEPTYDVVGDALVDGIKPFESELEPWEVYCLCNKCLYGMGIHNLLFDINSESKDALKKLVRDEVYCEQTNMLGETQGLNVDTKFSYKPEPLKRIYELSDQIFTEAKNVRILGKTKSIDAEGILAEMVELREELESFEHEYWNQQSGLYRSDVEISESTLDVDTINGLRLLSSFRLAREVENYEALHMCEAVKDNSADHRDELSDKERQELEERLQEQGFESQYFESQEPDIDWEKECEKGWQEIVQESNREWQETLKEHEERMKEWAEGQIKESEEMKRKCLWNRLFGRKGKQ